MFVDCTFMPVSEVINRGGVTLDYTSYYPLLFRMVSPSILGGLVTVSNLNTSEFCL